jgi:N-acetylglucosaminyl-diphospho-decaprenol L-rhamnosyltransferase
MTDTPAAALAVVIVNYNTGEWLTRCLRSLEACRGELAVDILVIDNDSRDDSVDMAMAAVPGARLVRNDTNRYLSPAWNQGAALTDAPHLLFLNPDTEWFHGTLADFVRVARAHPNAGLVGPMVRNPDGTVYASGRRFPSVVDAVGHAFVSLVHRDNAFTRRYHMDGWDRTTEREVDWVSGCCMLIPRVAFDAVDGFDEGFPLYAEELDIATRLRDAGWSVVFTPEVEITHAVGVSTGGDRRPHRLVVMHSYSLFRYYARHRATGWRRVTLPVAWAVLRARAELAWLVGRVTNR